MRRHLPRLLLTGALLSPASLYALGLGEIRLNSALNQPFDADIELIAPTNEELASLKIGLASNDLFSRYGIDRPAFLSAFEFSVARRRDGNASIKVTSNRSVTEPFVTLLVEASWGRGRLLREYTVLLDPPAFLPSQPEAPPPVTAPQAGARNDGRIERAPQPAEPAPAAPSPAPAQPPAAVPAPSANTSAPSRAADTDEAAPASSAVAATGTYTVERNDTLWRIASRVQPGSAPRVINQTMINQTMIALFRANPEAFGGNINRLRAGSILRIPETAEIESISTRDATAEVARQQEAWAGGTATTAADSDRLRLVTPAETAPAPAAAPSPPVETPRPATPATPAAPAASAPGSADKRLEVTSPELAGVQRNTAGAPPAPPEEIAAPAPPAEQPPQAETAPTPPPAAVTPAPVEEPSPSILSRLGDFWWVFVALGLLVVALLAVLKRRRDPGDSLDALSPDYEPPQPRGALKARERERAEPFAVADDETKPDFDEPSAAVTRRPEVTRARFVEPVEPVPPPVAADDTLSSESAVRFDQQDALAEADFHMAYGLYDQAADLVKIAIDREPQRRDLKLKLLEIYFVWGNRDLFLDTARDLHHTRASATLVEWDKVVIMGKQIAPDDPIFKDEGTSHVDLVDVNLEGGENRVDVDLFAEPEPDKSSGLDLEFGSAERPGVATTNQDLDFSLESTADRHRAVAEDEPTREFDPLARTQETPTVESPLIDRASQTIREKVDKTQLSKADQTAELSLDDLGLDVDALDATGSLEDTTSLTKESDDEPTRMARHIADDEMTQLAPSLSSFDRTMEAPRVEKFDVESTGTIYIDQVDLASNAGGDTVEQARPDIDSTASLKGPSSVDVDLSEFAGLDDDDRGADDTKVRNDDTLSHAIDRDAIDHFSKDVFADEGTTQFARVDLDVGDALNADDAAPTNRQVATNEMELSELEPVTMSEVGTKLDLARAYMDMGDPDGARSILEEVVQEGNPNQKQEAQRLLDSVR